MKRIKKNFIIVICIILVIIILAIIHKWEVKEFNRCVNAGNSVEVCKVKL